MMVGFFVLRILEKDLGNILAGLWGRNSEIQEYSHHKPIIFVYNIQGFRGFRGV